MARANEYDAMLRGDDFTVDVAELAWAKRIVEGLRSELIPDDADSIGEFVALTVAAAACEALYRAANRAARA